jgi:leucyl aminopeptidase (aminopeptidase T)
VRDYVVIGDPATLRVLSHPERLAILRCLGEAPGQTGAQVAEILGLPANRVHYHIGHLLGSGLVVQVGSGRRRWKEERLYAAVARHFVLDPAVGGASSDTARELLHAAEQSFVAWRRRELMRLDFGSLAEKIVRDCLCVRPGETVLTIFGGPALELGESVVATVESVGAKAAVRLWSRSVVFGLLDRLRHEALQEFAFVDPAIDRELDAVLLLSTSIPQGGPPSPEQAQRLPLLMQSVSRWHQSIRGRVRYLEVALPHRGIFGGVATAEQGLDLYWGALNADYESLRGRGRRLLDRIGKATSLRITCPEGTLLNVPIEAGRWMLNDGVASSAQVAKSLPAGSILCLPASGAANGRIRNGYTYVSGAHVLGIDARVEGGSIVEVEASSGDVLRERLRSAAGDATVLSAVGFGINPCRSVPVGERTTAPGLLDQANQPSRSGLPVLDSCKEGVVSVSFGNNELLGGTVRSTLDLTVPLDRASLWADDVPLVLHGRLAIVAE